MAACKAMTPSSTLRLLLALLLLLALATAAAARGVRATIGRHAAGAKCGKANKACLSSR